MRKVFYGFLALIVVVLAAVFVVPSFIDWNAQKSRLTEEVRKVTGRELVINGDMSLELLPAPALSASEVRFANIEGGTAPYMAELEALQVNIALLPLLQGQIQIKSVELVKPKILLEVLADGRTNWDMASGLESAPAAEASGVPEGGSSAFAEQIRVDSFKIENGDLTYRDARNGTEERVETLNVEVVAESLTGPVTAVGRARVRGIETGLDLAVGRIVRSGATPVKVSVSLPEAGATAQFTGSVSLRPDDVEVRGRLKGEGKDLAAVVATLGRSNALAPTFAQAFSLQAEVTGDLAGFTASSLDVRTGDMALTGEIVARTGPPLDVQVRLASGRIELDQLLARVPLGRGDDGGAAGSAADTGGAQPDSDFGLPKDLKARLELAVEGLIYREQAVRQLRLDAFLEDGKITLGEAKALMPGGSEVSLNGAVTNAAGPLQFTGRGALTSDNLRALATWLGADLSAVPADRLRRLDFTTAVAATPGQISLSEIDLKLDLSRITGGVVMAIRERPGFGIGLSIDTLNLDAYLPTGQAVTVEQTAQSGEEQAPESEPKGLEALNDFDANVSLRIGSLTYQGRTAKDLTVEASLNNGSLEISQGSFGDFAGGRGNLSGTLTNLAGEPSVDGRVVFTVSDPLRLARSLDIDPAPLARLGPFALNTGLRGSAKSVTIDAALDAQGASLTAKGPIEVQAQPPAFDLAITAKHPRLSDLAKVLELPVALQPGLGGLDFSGQVKGTPEAMALSQMTGQFGPLGLSGNAKLTPGAAAGSVQDMALAVNLIHGDLNGLLAALGQSARFGPAVGGINLNGQLTGSDQKFQLSGLDGNLGPVSLNGQVAGDLTGQRPSVTAQLETSEIPLAAFQGAGGGGGAAGAASAPSQNGAERWSNEPLDLSGLRAIDAVVDLKAAAISQDKFRLSNAVVAAQLQDAVLDLKQFSGTLYNGAVKTVGKLDARSTPAFSAATTAIEVDLGALLRDQADFDRVSGPVSFDLNVSSSGNSERALVGALHGDGKVDGVLTIKKSVTEQVGGLALDILGAKIREVRGLLDIPSALLNSFGGTRPAQLSGTLQIRDGVASTQDLQLANEASRTETKGQASLPAWQVDSRTDLYTGRVGTKPTLTATLSGPLDDPNYKLTGLGRKGPSESPTQSGGDEPAAQEPEPKQEQPEAEPLPIPEEIDPNKILEDVFKGLSG